MRAPLTIFLLLSVLALMPRSQEPLHAQPQPRFTFDHLTVADGLATHAVNAIVQDRQGFLWFGTDDGLHRYDGYGFIVYRHDPAEPGSLGSNQVNALYEDRAGTLWVGTSGGLHRLDRATGGFTRYRHRAADPHSLSHDVVWVIGEDRAGMLWVGTGDGLNRFDQATARFTRFKHDPNDLHSLSSNRVSAIYADRSGALWVGTVGAGYLNRFDRDTGRFVRYPIQEPHQHRRLHDQAPSFADNAVHAIHEDQSGALWVGTWRGGLYRLGRDAQVIAHFRHDPADPNSLGSDYVTAIAEDADGMLWLGSTVGLAPWGSHGLTRFDPATQTFTRIAEDPMSAQGFHGRWVRAIYRDRAGTLWIAASDYGINKVDPGTGTFTVFPYTPHHQNNLHADGAWAVYESRDGALWIGTDEGLERLDRATGRSTWYRYSPDNPSGLSHAEVKCLLEDRAGLLWVGTWGGGLNRFDPATQTFIHYRHDPADPASIGGDLVDTIYEDRDGTLWVGTWSGTAGLNRFDREQGRFTRFGEAVLDGSGLRFVSSLYEDSRGTLWMGADGLIAFDRATGRFTQYLQGQLIYTIYEDRAGRLWVGGQDSFYRFDRATGTAESFKGRYGLPADGIISIVGDAAGHLWLAKTGLFRFDPEAQTVRAYGLTDGLRDLRFNRSAAFQSPQGEIFLGSRGGAVAFYPRQVMENRYVPPVVLTDLKLVNKPATPGTSTSGTVSLTTVEAVTLAYYQNDLTFEFAALNYRRPEKNRYAYRLEGYDETWREVGTQRTATYANLAPGTYVFRVKGANDDGVWNEEGASVRLTITPPFWRRGWFYALCVVALLVVVVGSYRVRVRQLKQRQRQLAREVAARTHELALEKAKTDAQAEKLQAMDRLKSRFFTNISHEFRTPLTLILGPLHDALAGLHGPLSREDLRMMLRSGLRLQRLINQLLDLSKLEAGRMRLQARRQSLPAFLRGLVQSFASLAERRQVTLQYRAEPEELWLYFDADKLEQVVSNLLANAFKFTPAQGRIEVRVREETDDTGRYAEIVVSDTGSGIAPDHLPHIFDRFTTTPRGPQRAGAGEDAREAIDGQDEEGAGIGLALARELVERHGGTIHVESTRGVGTTFTVRLPRGTEHLAAQDLVDEAGGENVFDAVLHTGFSESDETPPGETPPGETPGIGLADDLPLVLVVEDNADVRAYLRGHLVPLYRVEEAGDGVEGLEKARALLPDLILSDVMMPRLDGYGLCKALKSDPNLDHIPLVLLTAKADEESRLEGLEMRADDYLYKPFNAAELRMRVENLIEIRRLLRQRFGSEVHLRPIAVTVSSAEAVFITQVRAVIEAHLADRTFTVDRLADEVALSPRQLQRKLRALTRLSPSGLIRSMRLERAAQLLERRAGNVSEVALAVGFHDVKYFSRLFKQAFGVSPSGYGAAKSNEA